MTVNEIEEIEKRDSRFQEFSYNEDYEKKIEAKMDERFAQLEARLGEIFGNNRKGRGKGKKVLSPQPSSSEAACERLKAYVKDIQGSRASTSSSLFTDDEDLPLRPKRPRVRTTTKTVYIKKIDCLINNTSVDQGIYLFHLMLK